MTDAVVIFRAVVDVGSRDATYAVVKALTPEAKVRLRGVKTAINIVGESTIELVIEAPDHSSFRAAANAMLRLMSSTIELIRRLGSMS